MTEAGEAETAQSLECSPQVGGGESGGGACQESAGGRHWTCRASGWPPCGLGWKTDQLKKVWPAARKPGWNTTPFRVTGKLLILKLIHNDDDDDDETSRYG